MADKEAQPPKTGEDIFAWLFGLIIIVALIGTLLTSLQARFGSLSPSAIFARYRLSEDTPLGLTVRTTGETLVWSGAASGELLGTHLSGVLGILEAGPVSIEDVRWWSVDFEENPDGWVSEITLELENKLISFGRTFRIVSGIVSLLFLTGVVYSLWRTTQIRKDEAKIFTAPPEGAFETGGPKNNRWQDIVTLVSSDNPNDWRAAILEADVMLDDLVTTMGYPGDGLGEKMQAIEQSDFTTLDKAWEAHKVRNRIAHEGGDFLLTQREARRIIGLFEDVFKEFNVI